MVIGHTEVVSRVEAERPPVALFLGPSSVGKWTVAEYLRQVWRVDDGDTLRIIKLTVPAAQDAVKFASFAPSGDRRLIIIRLTHAAPHAMHILLKTLEEGHLGCDFILLSEETPLATVVSRASVYRFGYLEDSQVTDILVRRNFRPEDAERYATMAGGQVSRAISAINNKELHHGVMMVVKAFRELDPKGLDAASKEWTPEHTDLLAQWCRESLTGRHRIFSDEEVIDSRPVPFRILQALNANVRPRLLVRSNLMAVLRGDA